MPIDDRIVLDGLIDRKKIRALKGNGCNTNVASQAFSERNRKHFDWKKCKVEVSHSQKGSVENSPNAILGATSQSESIGTSLIVSMRTVVTIYS